VKAFMFYCGTCAALLLLALAARSLGEKQASIFITGGLLLASICIIMAIFRQHK